MIRLIWDKATWCKAIKSEKNSDFYHTYDYHHLSSDEEESPVLIEYSKGSQRILLPLLIRMIPGTDYKDATSVYGYSGPLGIGLENDFDNTQFKKELMELFKNNNIVTVFSRLNPFIPYQSLILKGIGEINSPGKVVYIDLTKDRELQWAKYNRRLKSYINKSREEYILENAKSNQEIRVFIDIYLKNMERLGANKRYFFTDEYFFNLIGSEDINTEVILAKRSSDNQYVGGALFIKKNQIIQYHLSGAREDALKLNPIKLLIDEMSIRSKNEGFKYLNLGGGVGNKADSLFKFKSTFSKDYKDFDLWKLVVDQNTYHDLIIKTKMDYRGVEFPNRTNFFPRYRLDK